ncbi:hypothetical protein [Solidesulfovibrio alcoholivorans]|uniref:hypothetical protein n=1 Tax=Solidesulfovibrio alcoholivorans TaxID=81406 RepID=UPI000495FBE5|nr:hypothetical protein [Solidesulfovibrio alcoholivorans]
MTRREKIILALTGVVAVAGLWMGLGGDAPPPPAVPAARQETAQAGSMLAAIKDAALTPAEEAMVAAIGASWPQRAFYDKPFAGQTAAKPVSRPRFTGYVELGSGRLAVVDGMEYQVGDTLESGGYKVVAIAPEQVALESLANGQRIEIPYEGRDAAQ